MASKYDYSKIDPILKENPDIDFTDFKEKCDIEITKWAFLARKKFLKGEPGYGRKEPHGNKSVKTDSDGCVVTKDGRRLSIKALILEVFPNTSKIDEFTVVTEALIKDPLTTHDRLIANYQVDISDSYFYNFRRNFIRILGLEPDKKVVKKASNYTKRKKNVLYQTVFQKEIGENINPESLELLQEFIEYLNIDRQNLELLEITKPVHMIEVRAISK